MTSTPMSTGAGADASAVSTVSMRFEVTTLPVADVDRAKAFYLSLGWRLDIDFEPAPGVRGVQFTPPGSPASIQFGSGPATVAPGRLQNLFLIVEDIVAARDDLVSRGVDVSEIWHFEPGLGKRPGLDPERGSYSSRADFADPDGNRWLLQELTVRLPGRVAPDVAELAPLLLETEQHHGRFEAEAPPHDWWDWYAAYLSARQQGAGADEADAAADRYMAEVKHVVITKA
jgi:catechol 2,3-dioxygenase-like lactoylglutathione lyase family enzyme